MPEFFSYTYKQMQGRDIARQQTPGDLAGMRYPANPRRLTRHTL